jgi:beta-glucosidase
VKIPQLFFRALALAALSPCAFAPANAQSAQSSAPYRNAQLPISERVRDLLARMTAEEKVAQLQCEIGEMKGREGVVRGGVGSLAVPLRNLGPRDAATEANRLQRIAVQETRLGIPVLIHDEALHGLVGREATSFPQAIALAATWHPVLVEEVTAVIARQTRSRGVRHVLSPVLNIARDVRWGRVEETFGEDPFLTSRIGAAFCKVMERAGVVSTPKHFAANVGDGGRDSNVVHFSERLLREIYFPAFRACIQEGGARSVMASYNSVDGIPASANRWLLTDILRGEWGFTGFVVSDYGSVGGVRTLHRTAATPKDTAVQTLNAGLEIELPGISYYGKPLLEAVREGLVTPVTLDTAVGRVLRAKFELGLFENPYADAAEAARSNDTPADRALALRAAREAIVLLKNDNAALPLKKDLRAIAVIGPNADVARLGGYSGFGMKVVTPLEGIRRKLPPATQVYFAKGAELGTTGLPPIPAANLVPAGGATGAQGLRGEYFTNMTLTGEPALVRTDAQIHFDWESGSPDSRLSSDRYSVRWTGALVPNVTGAYKLSITTDDGVRLWLDGKLVVDSWFDRGASADFFTVPLEAGRRYALRIEYYENGGFAFASLGWDVQAEENKEIAAAVEAARKSDVAVIFAGYPEGEGRDRADLNLPAAQEELIRRVAATRVPTVVVLIGGSAVTMENWGGLVPAIVDAWYAGEEGGNAIADVLFGDYNPAGKLPITFPQTVGQVPLYYNPKPTGRSYDYITVSGKPLFPFGHGLSYTQFEYTNLQISPAATAPDGIVEVRVDVRNSGARAGDEVVQLYIHDAVASVSRPLKELKGFQRISLAPGETKTVVFTLGPQHLVMLDIRLKPIVEPGTFEVMIGSSSEDIRLKGAFEVNSGAPASKRPM